MSMISTQCDELRKTADELDEKAKAYAPTAHNALSPMLRQAADTIWELRCKLAGVVDQQDEIERLEDENAKLRMEVDEHGNIKVTSYIEVVVLSKEEQEQALRIFKQLQEENEKLRDYVYALSECKEKACLCEYCPHGRNDFDDDNTFIHCDFDFEQLKQDAGIE